jgi:hypothetical protein
MVIRPIDIGFNYYMVAIIMGILIGDFIIMDMFIGDIIIMVVLDTNTINFSMVVKLVIDKVMTLILLNNWVYRIIYLL